MRDGDIRANIGMPSHQLLQSQVTRLLVYVLFILDRVTSCDGAHAVMLFAVSAGIAIFLCKGVRQKLELNNLL